MEADRAEKYALNAEWFDPEAARVKHFFFFYYPADNSVELYDKTLKRSFLKRTRIQGLTSEDIYVGNCIKVFSRQMKLIDYANEYTKQKMGLLMQKTLAIIMPDAIEHKGSILRTLCAKGFKVSNLKMFKATTKMARDFFKAKEGNPEYESLVDSLSHKPVIAIELVRNDAVNYLKQIVGPEDPDEARKTAPESIRACFAKSKNEKALHCSETLKDAIRELKVIFVDYGSCLEISTAVFKDSTCCVIKPHAIREGKLGEIVFLIEEEGYTITAMQMFYLEVVNAEEFYEVYKGVSPEYSDMVSEIVDGGCLALEVTGPIGPETPIDFRKFIGPSDPDIARQLRPITLRAKCGVDKIKNAVHVTDLPDDAILEVEYFFKILT